ncbi:hypothetical protein [Pantoea brenneri]|uniref:hypothetical protein n=1 Tax=Pantoea brenneri TaxID=472694 RepID=UPI00289EEBA0|nr:hypothetical protein [Pantoea brenneri]
MASASAAIPDAAQGFFAAFTPHLRRAICSPPAGYPHQPMLALRRRLAGDGARLCRHRVTKFFLSVATVVILKR